MAIYEFRIPVPLTLDEYRRGHAYVYANSCLEETGGGEGVLLVKKSTFSDHSFLNGQFTAGEYTERIVSFKSKCSRMVRWIAPDAALKAVEKCWYSFPFCRTVLTSKGHYKIEIDSLCMENPWRSNNALQVPTADLPKREVKELNIAGEVDKRDYQKRFDPTKYHSERTGRGPLNLNWAESTNPTMGVYKVMRIEIYGWKWLKDTILKNLLKEFARRYILFNRRVFCSLDLWIGLSADQLRGLVEDAERESKENFAGKGIRGTAQLSSGS